MDDLISRNSVINLLHSLRLDNVAMNGKRITKYINELPVAYDVEKVKSEIRDKSDYEPIDYDCGDISCTDEQHFIATDEAINIIERGGVQCI